MDTPTDFIFLDERIVMAFNPFDEGEYLVIQIYPYDKTLKVIFRSFCYELAQQECDLENLNEDTSFEVKIFHCSKLWDVNYLGKPFQISQEQDWKIQEDFLEANNGEIVICLCSYPYFNQLRISDGNEHWQSLTCLVEDNNREIEYCPNCDCRLLDEDDEDDDDEFSYDFSDEISTPMACIGCCNYHGQEYGGNLLNCAIYPQGWINDENCPDYSKT